MDAAWTHCQTDAAQYGHIAVSLGQIMRFVEPAREHMRGIKGC
jgi:hypothetical protein